MLRMTLIVWTTVALAGLAMGQDARGPVGPVSEGEEFPNFTARDAITGDKIELADFRGKVVLIDFWATWCPPCRAEIPHIKEVYQKHHDDGFEIISISLDSDVDDMKAYADKHEMDWHHIADGKGWDAKLGRKYGVRAIPKAYVIGKDGKVISDSARGGMLDRAVEKGLAQEWEGAEQAEADAARLLAEAREFEQNEEYAPALNAYEEAARKYKATPSGRKAAERAKEMRADPKMKAAIKEAKAGAEADKWLDFARQMRESEQHDIARKYYQRIIDEHPDSPQAKEAKAELDELPK